MATYYWIGGSGTWDNADKTNWATSSGGSGGNGPPVAADTVNFDSNSGTSATVTVAATAACTTCIVNKSDINLSLSGSPTFGGGFTFTSGTLTLNGNTLTVRNVSSSNSNVRTIAFDTAGKIVLTGNDLVTWTTSTVTNFAYTGTSNVTLSYSGSTGTRLVVTGSSTVAQAINFTINGGSDTVYIVDTPAVVGNLIFTSFTGTLTNSLIWSVGNVTFSSGMTVGAGASQLVFYSSSSSQAFTTNGVTIDRPIRVGEDGRNPIVTLQDNLTMASGRSLIIGGGTFNGNGNNVTVGALSFNFGTKTLTLGNGTWTCLGNWDANTNVTGLTVSASTGTISMTSGSAKTFSGGGKTWPTLNQGGAGALTIAQSNTFANITNTTQPATITLTAGTTQTVSALGIAGTAGNVITLNSSSAGSKATISRSSGLTNLSYVSIKDIAATGAAFYAYLFNGNTNTSGNTGIRFNLPEASFSPTLFI